MKIKLGLVILVEPDVPVQRSQTLAWKWHALDWL